MKRKCPELEAALLILFQGQRKEARQLFHSTPSMKPSLTSPMTHQLMSMTHQPKKSLEVTKGFCDSSRVSLIVISWPGTLKTH